MELHHEFTVPVPVEQAWDVLLDVERLAPCMPGAVLDEVRGDEFEGRVKVRVGPINVTYGGTASFAEKDVENHRLVIVATGKEAKGAGTAAATITAVLKGTGDETLVNVQTDLAITGRPAQFGRGVMVDVSNKLLGMFTDCLSEQISGGGARTEMDDENGSAADARQQSTPGPMRRAEPEAIDLLGIGGAPVMKWAAPALAAFVVLTLVLVVRGSRR